MVKNNNNRLSSQQSGLCSALDNRQVAHMIPLSTPNKLKKQQPIGKLQQIILQHRQTVSQILQGQDKRLLLVVGPCSIHDPIAAVDYAQQLAAIQKQVADKLFIVMRVYFAKPRSISGWQGLICDPLLDGSYQIEKGLSMARQLLIDINQLAMPCATEFLDTMTPQYISDLISWTAIGARTAESQIHRNLASSLSMPVGIKNPTSGYIHVAVDGLLAASQPHHF